MQKYKEVNRRPIGTERDEFGFLEFDDKGLFKITEHEKRESLTFDMLSYPRHLFYTIIM